MQVRKITDVFNLMDTNGRRKDLINAYTIYLKILKDIENSSETGWSNFPKSLNQYKFYKAAIKESPEVFKKHPQFDAFQQMIDNHRDVKEAFESKDKDKLTKLLKKYTNSDIYEKLDNAIEGRSRHYTSNLVKIGFTDKNRQLSSVGATYLNGYKLVRDKFEDLLPIKDGNLIFLRQLMKLKVYTKDYASSYSPMMMVFYLLLNIHVIDQSTLLNLSVLPNPYKKIPLEKLLQSVQDNDIDIYKNYIDFTKNPKYQELKKIQGKLDQPTFTKYIHNKKNKNYNKVYFDFYQAIQSYQETNDITPLFELYSEKRKPIDSAFGFGKRIFNFPKGQNKIQDFFQENKDNELLISKNLNVDIYNRYLASTRSASISEYSDTFGRLLKATGIVSFKNGIAELMYKNLWRELFKEVDLNSLIFEDYDKNQSKKALTEDNELNSEFRSNISITQIIQIPNIDQLISRIKRQLNIETSEEVKNTLLGQKDKQFKSFVKTFFPQEKVIKILKLFKDRSNDDVIQELVGSDAALPAIYEYIVGLAWYYISDETYNLYDSFNLSMNADFRPETFASGGGGDIVINYSNEILMIEVTLMNKQAQKRGEWEPVLRHTANLTIDKSPKKVQTLFIANELDFNTIHIWRAVASVPMRSSQTNKLNAVANNITIMPIKNEELCKFLDKNISSKLLLKEINNSFEKLNQNFDESWRSKILGRVLD